MSHSTTFPYQSATHLHSSASLFLATNSSIPVSPSRVSSWLPRASVVVFHHCYSCWPVRCIYVFLSLLLFVGYYLPISLWLDLEEKISFIIRVRYSSSMDLNRCYALPPSQQLLQGGCCSLLVSSQERFSLFPCTFAFSYRF